MGSGFDLQYTDFKEPFASAKELPQFSHYLKQDFQSLQLLISNTNFSATGIGVVGSEEVYWIYLERSYPTKHSF